jgi:hypothetical protein
MISHIPLETKNVRFSTQFVLSQRLIQNIYDDRLFHVESIATEYPSDLIAYYKIRGRHAPCTSVSFLRWSSTH